MKLSVAIMAHPSREKFIPLLKEKLGEWPVSYDNGEGIWANRKNATLLYNPTADFHLVIQDDAIIGQDFFANALRELENHPKDAHSFYLGNRRNWQALYRNAEKQGGLHMDWLSWGLAICLPTKLIPELIEYCDKMKGYEKNDDTRIAKFLEMKKIKIWFPVPSLIDHRIEKSLVTGETNKFRKAFKFIGE